MTTRDVPRPGGEGDDDIEARFRQIMAAEFGDAPAPQSGTAQSPEGQPPAPDAAAPEVPPAARRLPAQPPRTGARPPRDDFNLQRSLEQAVPDEPDEPFVAPEPAPLGTPRSPVLLGGLLAGGGLAVLLAVLFGARVNGLLTSIAGCCLVVGLAVLLFAGPRRPADPGAGRWSGDDGARL